MNAYILLDSESLNFHSQRKDSATNTVLKTLLYNIIMQLGSDFIKGRCCINMFKMTMETVRILIWTKAPLQRNSKLRVLVLCQLKVFVSTSTVLVILFLCIFSL